MQDNSGIKKLTKLTQDYRQFLRSLPRCIITYLVHGIIIIIPLAVTLWVLIWVFNVVDGILAPIITWGFGRPLPGVGFIVIITTVVLIGYFGLKFGHRRVFDFFETQIIRVPVVGSIYGGAREMLESFNATSNSKFLEVIFMEFPRKGIYTVGFVTKEAEDKDGRKVLNVFIPTAPTPAGGFLQIVPESEIIHTSMSISDAMKLIVSMGGVSRKDIADMLVRVPEPESKGNILEI